MGIQRIIRWLIPKEERFFDLLEQQAVVLHEAALTLTKMQWPDAVAKDIEVQVHELEHKGDALVRELQNALARTFVTPIDREDINLLCWRFDDALDLTHLTILTFVLYGVPAWTSPMTTMATLLVECADILRRTLPELRGHAFEAIMESGRAIAKLEHDADDVFRSTIGALFHDEDLKLKELLRQKEVLEALENAVDHCQDAADVLSHIAVKHP